MRDISIPPKRSLQITTVLNEEQPRRRCNTRSDDNVPTSLLLTFCAESKLPAGRAVHIQAVDLRHAWQQSARLRGESAVGGSSMAIIIDVQVMIRSDARAARTALMCAGETLDKRQPSDPLLYVGTSKGLAGLIADIHTLGIADGVNLSPLVKSSGLRKIMEEVVPLLQPSASAVTSRPVHQTQSA